MPRIGRIVGFTVCAWLLACGAVIAEQKSLTAEDIVNALQNNAGSTALSADDILNRLQNSFRIDEEDASVRLPGPSTSAILNDLPKIDFEIFFDYDSPTIKPESLPVLMEIGKALSGGKLSGNRFVVGGHTDAAGSPIYNAKLSQQRAEAVRDFLMRAFPVDGAKIVALGFGEAQLRNISEPLAAVNRRVQIVNLGK